MTPPLNLLPWQSQHKMRQQKMYLIATAYFIGLFSLSVFLSRVVLIERCHHWQQMESITQQQLNQAQAHLSLYQQLTSLHQQHLQQQQLLAKIKQYHQQLYCHLQQAILALPANSYWQDFNITPTDITLHAEVETEAKRDQWLKQWLNHDNLHLNLQSQQPSRLNPGQLQIALIFSTQS